MKRKFVLIAALVAALAVVFISCPYPTNGGGESTGGGTNTTGPDEQKPPPSAWDAATGMTTGIVAEGSATFSGGIIDFTHVGSGASDDGALFKVDLPSATLSTGTKTITITYICQVTTGNPNITLKDGKWGNIATANGTDGCNWYPTLTKDVVTTLTLKEAWYANATSTISFQRNGDTNAFKIKIIDVTVENIVWKPTITASTPINGNEYIGNTGIQAADKAKTTFTPIADGFTIAVTDGGYKPINIQTPNAGGTNYYTSEGFTACTTGTDYIITFMASVDTGTGQIRFKEAGASSYSSGSPINTTPTKLTYSWTQGSGNFQFDTGSTPTASVITITGIKITSP